MKTKNDGAKRCLECDSVIAVEQGSKVSLDLLVQASPLSQRLHLCKLCLRSDPNRTDQILYDLLQAVDKLTQKIRTLEASVDKAADVR